MHKPGGPEFLYIPILHNHSHWSISWCNARRGKCSVLCFRLLHCYCTNYSSPGALYSHHDICLMNPWYQGTWLPCSTWGRDSTLLSVMWHPLWKRKTIPVVLRTTEGCHNFLTLQGVLWAHKKILKPSPQIRTRPGSLSYETSGNNVNCWKSWKESYFLSRLSSLRHTKH